MTERRILIWKAITLRCPPPRKEDSERCAEVPWVANCLKEYDVKSDLDIGFTFASHDYLRFMLDFAKKNKLIGVDIIDPKKVQSRYPEDWRNEIEQTKVLLGDFSSDDLNVNVKVDAVTIISTLEHIGFDKKNSTVNGSAFERQNDKQAVCLVRDENIEDKVLKNVSNALNTNGICLISVPAGTGGNLLMQDSKGLWACFCEYNKDSWKKIVCNNHLECIAERFFIQGDDNKWAERSSISDLSTVTSTETHASGVACCVLRKK